MSAWDLRLGRWQDALADVGMVDAVITDPPYSPRVHQGFRCQEDMIESQRAALARNRAKGRRDVRGAVVHGRMSFGSIRYAPMTEEEARAMVAFFAPRCRNWFVIFGDHISYRLWESALDAVGWYVFAPLVWVRTGGTPRFQGDGPACSVEWICVARPRRKTTCGSLPGHYVFPVMKGNHAEKILTGQKPVALMRALIRDYTDPGETIAEPYAGSGTTLLAAVTEGRRAIGSEMDPETYAKARARLEQGHTPDLFAGLAL